MSVSITPIFSPLFKTFFLFFAIFKLFWGRSSAFSLMLLYTQIKKCPHKHVGCLIYSASTSVSEFNACECEESNTEQGVTKTKLLVVKFNQ